MTAERIRRSHRLVGCVVHVETGVFVVLTDGGELRASLDGAMLAQVARNRSCLPEPGDWVELRTWCDGRITVARPLHAPPIAPVIELRR